MTQVLLAPIQSASVANVGHIMDCSFSQFSPFFQNDLERNDTSFESPKIELLESSMKLGVARP